MTRKRKHRLIFAGVILCLMGLAAPTLVRGVIRYRAQADLLKSPQALERLKIVPKSLTLTPAPPAHLVDLGYAQFDFGGTAPTSIVTAGSSSTWIIIKNDELSITISAPFSTASLAQDSPSTLALINAGKSEHPVLEKKLKRILSNPVDAQFDAEKAQLLSFSKLMWMSDDDYASYILDISAKARNSFGLNQVEYLTTPDARAVAQIGQSATDQRHALIDLVSSDGTMNIGLNFTFAQNNSQDSAARLHQILASFHFTIPAIKDREQIAKLIAARGIPKKGETPTTNQTANPSR